MAGVPSSSSSTDNYASTTAVAAILQHGPTTHLVHQTVDLLLIGRQIRLKFKFTTIFFFFFYILLHQFVYLDLIHTQHESQQ